MTKKKKIIIASGLFIFALLGAFSFLFLANRQKIAWGVRIAGYQVQAANLDQSKELLQKHWQDYTAQTLTMNYQGQTWTISPTDLGFSLDATASINQAYQLGHTNRIFTDLYDQTKAALGFGALEPVIQINQEIFDRKTAEIFKNSERLVQDAGLFFNATSSRFELVPSQPGTIIDRRQMIDALLERIKDFSAAPVNLATVTDQPAIQDRETEQAARDAQRIIDRAPYYLIAETGTWTVDKKKLLEWIKFEPSADQILIFSLDNEKVSKYLYQISGNINQPAQDAQLTTEGRRAIIFNPGQDGYGVHTEETIANFKDNLLADPPIKNTYVIADKTAHQIKLAQTNDLGINTLIGQGASNFAGSSANRTHNIKLGASKFHGLILAPGEEFSFNTLLGPSGLEDGYRVEQVIKNKQIVLEPGGGLCQVSTTMFRAAVNSGLKITERQGHAFPVKYYNPQGFDATIYSPRPDLKFINNTPNYLLIQAVVAGTKLTFNFYATDDQREVKIKGPYILEQKEDGSMKTVLTQEIHRDGQLAASQDFFTNYKSPNLFEKVTN